MHISSSFQISSHMAPHIAVLSPCYNEAATIAQVIAAFRASLPSAQIYVFDNASSDASASIARESGAIVVDVLIRGKGNVVRRMFADVDADVYVMADADLTYDSRRAAELIAPILTGEVDTVIATRTGGDGAYPGGHRFGNRLFNVLVAGVFGQGLNDIFQVTVHFRAGLSPHFRRIVGALRSRPN